MSLFGELLTAVFDRRARFTSPTETDTRPVEELATSLVATSGEESARALALQLLERFEGLSDGEKRNFFAFLSDRMNILPDAVRTTLAAYEASPGRESYRAFMAASEPARQELIRRLNMVGGGTRKLVAMRADLLRLTGEEDTLAALDLDFRHLFASWFNRGFLVLRPINWESPAHVLEKIIAYEAVHHIDSWEELRQRLEPPDRRCFAFFHPAMPEEPLVFVEVALAREIPSSIQAVLAHDREEIPQDEATTAVFYSISNCQRGLDGITFGNSLIKQVVSDLSAELPGIKTFATLSPMPGLVDWINATRPDLIDLASDAEVVTKMAAYYLLNAKTKDGHPVDPVARFHLRNGAEVYRLHANADVSPNGQRLSRGAMVNYLYDLDHGASNHEQFAEHGRIAASKEVRSLSADAEVLLSMERNT